MDSPNGNSITQLILGFKFVPLDTLVWMFVQANRPKVSFAKMPSQKKTKKAKFILKLFFAKIYNCPTTARQNFQPVPWDPINVNSQNKPNRLFTFTVNLMFFSFFTIRNQLTL